MYIFEAILLLALDEEEGKISDSNGSNLNAVLAGAVLSELVLQERITLTDGRIVVINQIPSEHPILDGVLYSILDTAKPRKVRYWINTLVYQEIMTEVIQTLVEQGVLERKKKHFRLASQPGNNPGDSISHKFILANRLRSIVLTAREPPQSEIVLLTFLYQANLLKRVFMQGERKIARKRIQKLIETDHQNNLVSTLNEIVEIACDADRC